MSIILSISSTPPPLTSLYCHTCSSMTASLKAMPMKHLSDADSQLFYSIGGGSGSWMSARSAAVAAVQ